MTTLPVTGTAVAGEVYTPVTEVPPDREYGGFVTRTVAFAIDAAAKANFVALVFGDDVAAGPAGVEFAWPVAILDAEAEGIIGGPLLRRDFGRHEQLH